MVSWVEKQRVLIFGLLLVALGVYREEMQI